MAKFNPIKLQKYLKGVDYPAAKNDLIARAKDNGASDEVMHFLERIPEREYGGPNGVTKEISQAEKGSSK